jgi:hypothetical protein
MATDAQIVKCPLRPLFIAVLVSRVLRVAVHPVTGDTLHKHGHATELSSLMMTADALSALLRLMSKLTIRIQVRFVMPVPEKNYAACSLEIELDDASSRVAGLYPVAIVLLSTRTRPRQQGSRHSDNKDSQHCKLESHLFTGLP